MAFVVVVVVVVVVVAVVAVVSVCMGGRNRNMIASSNYSSYQLINNALPTLSTRIV